MGSLAATSSQHTAQGTLTNTLTSQIGISINSQGRTSSTNSQNLNTGAILEKSQSRPDFIQKKAVKENLQVIIYHQGHSKMEN